MAENDWNAALNKLDGGADPGGAPAGQAATDWNAALELFDAGAAKAAEDTSWFAGLVDGLRNVGAAGYHSILDTWNAIGRGFQISALADMETGEFPEGATKSSIVGQAVGLIGTDFDAIRSARDLVSPPKPGAAATIGEAMGGAVALPMGGLRSLPKELLVAAGGGAAEATAEAVEQGAGGQAIANIAGSYATGGAMRIPGYVRSANRARMAFTEGGAKRMAAAILQDTATDLELARRRLAQAAENPGAIPKSSAQLAGDQALSRLEAGIMRASDSTRSRFNSLRVDQTAAFTAQLDDMARAENGTIAETGAFIQDRAALLTARLDRSVQGALDKAQRDFVALDTMRRGDLPDVAIQARAALDEAYSAGRAAETELYAAVPKDELVPPATLKARIEELTTGANSVEQKLRTKVPADVQEVIDQDLGGALTSVDKLQSFRSIMLERQRAALSGPTPDRQLARIYRELGEAALTDIGIHADRLATNGSPAAEALLQAHQFSRALNDTFTRGPMGRIMQIGPNGGDRVAAADTLKSLLRTGVSGNESGKAVKATTAFLNRAEIDEQALAALGGREAVEMNTKAGLVEMFRDAVIKPNGDVDPVAMQAFVSNKKFGYLLDQFPDVKALLTNAGTSGQIAKQLAGQRDTIVRSIGDRNRSRAALFLDGDADTAFASALKSANQAEPFRKLVAQVRRDPTGQAENGLKRAFLQELTAASAKGPALEVMAGNAPAYSAFGGFLKEHQKAANILFNDAERARLTALGRELDQIDSSARATGGKPPNVAPNNLLSAIVGAGGAIVGGMLNKAVGSGGGSYGALAVPATISRAGKNWLQEMTATQVNTILEEAVFDPKLYEALLAHNSPLRPELMAERVQIIHQHLVANGLASTNDRHDAPAAR